MNRQWWRSAVKKAHRSLPTAGSLINEVERAVYKDFINSRIGGGLRTTAVRGAAKNPASSRGRLGRLASSFPSPPQKKLGYELHDDGAKRLVCAVVEQAVADFKLLVRHGRIVNGKAMPSKRRKIFGGYEYQDHVKQLLHFFAPGGPMDTWFLIAGIKINPNLVRQKLGIE